MTDCTQEPYKITEFRHANDAQFCDLAHAFVPRLLSKIEVLQNRIKELEMVIQLDKTKTALTNDAIDKIGESMPGGLQGFMKTWGWRQFARAIEAANGIKS